MNKKIISLLLLLVMVVEMLPGIDLNVSAAGMIRRAPGSELMKLNVSEEGTIRRVPDSEPIGLSIRVGSWDGIRYRMINDNGRRTAEVIGFDDEVKEKVILPEGVRDENGETYWVKSIGKYAFCECEKLIEIVLPDCLMSIEEGAFYHCIYLGRVKNFSNRLINIGKCAFGGCYVLDGVKLPDGLDVIGECAFDGCDSLSSITIPASVEIIGKYAFRGCTCLDGIIVDDSNTNYSSEGGVLFDKNKTVLKQYPGSYFATNIERTKYVVPETVKYIEDYAFSYCSKLFSVIIPEGVEDIGSYAFTGCCRLESIEIPSSVKHIGKYTFAECKSLNSVTIPDGITSIKDGTFFDANLKSIIIPNSVTNIEANAFYECYKLEEIVVSAENRNYKSEDGNLLSKDGTELIKVSARNLHDSYEIPRTVKVIKERAIEGALEPLSVVIPEGITNIETNAFFKCRKLATITIPASVTSIGTNAFYGCEGLEKIIVNAENPNYKSEDGVLFNKTGTNLILYPAKREADSYKVAEGVKVIEENAFMNCSNLLSVEIQKSVTTIGENAFKGCYKLVSVTIPSSANVGKNAFCNCRDLREKIIV